jgi:lysophospholipase L1-like esterase
MALIKKTLSVSAIVIISVILTLSLLELTIRIFYKFKSSPRGKANLPVSKTYRLSNNKNLLYELLPNSRATIQGKEYAINATGFRDKDYPKITTNSIRIICVGDSITYGWRIPIGKTYHKQLERLFEKRGHRIDVMGMGVPGYNTVQEYHLIKDKALDFNPDMILLQISPNDFERTVGIKKFRKGKRLTLAPLHDCAIPFVLKKTKFTTFAMRRSHLFKFVNLKLYGALHRDKSRSSHTPQDVYLMGEEKAFQHLWKINSLLDGRNIRLAAVIFPFEQREDTYTFASLHERMRAELEKMDVPYLDLHDKLNPDQGEDIWFERRHPNARGYAIATRAIFRFIKPLLVEHTKDRWP